MTAEVAFSGIDIWSVMETAKASPQGQQRLKYSELVVGALGQSLTVEIQVADVPKYRTTHSGTLPYTATGISLPNQFTEPPSLNVADALTANAKLVIKGANGVAMSVPVVLNGSDSALTANVSLTGSNYIRTNGVIFKPPTLLDANVGGGDENETAFTIDSIISQMGNANDEAPLYSSPSNGTWQHGSVVVMGADWRFASTPEWWPANTAISQTSQWTSFLPWFVVWDGYNHGDNLNCRVAMKDFELWICNSNWVWSRIQGPTSSLSGSSYRRDLQGDVDGADERTESDGSFSVRFNHSSTAVYHGWTTKVNNVSSTGMRGLHVRMKARKVVHSSSQTDQRNQAVYLIHCGGDPYPTAASHANNRNQDSNYLGVTWLPGAGASRFSYVTNEWKTFSYMNLNNALELDNSPRGTRSAGWVMSPDDLRAHPVPLS